jgi:hypothetical protein
MIDIFNFSDDGNIGVGIVGENYRVIKFCTTKIKFALNGMEMLLFECVFLKFFIFSTTIMDDKSYEQIFNTMSTKLNDIYLQFN